jgi:hypothetical protein
VFIHGINPIIKIFHRQTSDYYTFDKTIKFLAHKVKSGKIAETTRPRREYLILTAPQNQCRLILYNHVISCFGWVIRVSTREILKISGPRNAIFCISAPMVEATFFGGRINVTGEGGSNRLFVINCVVLECTVASVFITSQFFTNY